MSADYEVTSAVTPEDMEFRTQARAAGLPDIVISMYGTALRKLVSDEREACAVAAEKQARWIGYTAHTEAIAAAIRARSKE